ncbi:MAG: flavodoxin-dependent (E)-4-hydroxy-3-methylbut-2-enyl-diphosphate synthase [Faecalibacterium sp.]|nr:flavodoxin-dependent (E)-4-hydroxy-3-methylbut-2-enyl-diphosphate synthase [Ruminococcus sp.]MCM1392002.1 flavodoxin-dependent (E)-4-hydroxy-3-methylbut-2-enyl-diphosphate synthase [Ruminococcus sp.]MCM1485567.1 flavodoxin-dependent (E)-4-hydroxy-3-methylbut-2-enyl-diphosphate synthase [Faecalibacterium sp.]
MIERRKTKAVKVGSFVIGGDSDITVQSMLNIPAHDIDGNVKQALALEKAGCQIIRVAVPDSEAVKTVYALKNAVDVPVVADIHFNHKIALDCVDAGVDKIRINPGNIGADENVKAVAEKCKAHGVPIRIGVNSGSVEKDILAKYGAPTPMAMAESAMYHVRLLEKYDFDDIVISIKSSDVHNMIKAYETVAQMCDYPLHLGVTESGTQRMGLIKSSVGIGSLLTRGIGDTIRVSLTADPVNEVYAGFDILKAIGMKKNSPALVSCPTCGRTKIDLISLANEVEERLRDVDKPLKVAVMGCAVNGPGEAREADIGIAGGDGCGLIFKHGEILRKVAEDKIVDELFKEIESMK